MAQTRQTFLLDRSRLTVGTTRWIESKKHADFLLPPGKQLTGAVDLLQAHPDLDPRIVEYIQTSSRKAKGRTRVRRAFYVAFNLVVLFAFGSYTQCNSNSRVRQASYYEHRAQQELSAGDKVAAIADYKEGLRLYQALNSSASVADLHRSIAEIELDSGNRAAADQEYTAALEASASKSMGYDAQVCKAIQKYQIDHQDTPGALQTAQRCLDSVTRSTESRDPVGRVLLSVANANVGAAKLADKDGTGAVKAFQQSVELDQQALDSTVAPKSITLKSALGFLAVGFLLSADPASHCAGLADSHEELKEYKLALQGMQECLDRFRRLQGQDQLKSTYSPMLSKIYTQLSWDQLLNGMPEAAAQSARMALAIDPTLVRAKVNLAHGYQLTDRRAQAMKLYAEVQNERASDGRFYKDLIPEDWKRLERAGISTGEFAGGTPEVFSGRP